MQDIRLKTPIELEQPESLGEKCAGYLENIMSSWTCLFITIAALIGWIILANNKIIVDKSDLFLNLLLSMGSFLEANIILIADKRQTSINKRRSEESYKMIKQLINQNQELISYIKSKDKDDNI